MSDVLIATIRVEIDRETEDVRWHMEGIENGSTDAGLLFRALVRILEGARHVDPEAPKVH